ncbi:2-dehydro-3-deoxygalactonokinase [Ramlibacter sp.]|uniref:2-dehydro-3-deoxygalactonokinase n=1 Tax=Ramlibacter sp. TaxID=1917967 RepID=UPI00185EE848|nr:2-dehydro-3-deoxygalactonokinase [Ramlibacter sp.]MBA2673250.1 2-dehydro-3-deoxygalactonokinase [Ramlibacter sp.]
MNTLVAVDWGTSSLRAVLLSDSGEVLQERSAQRGIMTVPTGGFRAVFDELCGDWMQQAQRALICGMAGSRQGWQEAPYCACPAGQDALAGSLAWIEPQRIAIVPGLRCEHDSVPDVMRGEETQVVGALRLLGIGTDRATLVLPGTHSKWARAEGGRIASFSTFMTGEFYALLRHHSLLARTMPEEDGALNEEAFRRGVAHARACGNLLHAAFSARTLALFDRMQADALPSYLSGLVIGEELRSQVHEGDAPLVLVGAPALTQRYALALGAWGVQARSVGPEATWAGLRAIADTLE